MVVASAVAPLLLASIVPCSFSNPFVPFALCLVSTEGAMSAGSDDEEENKSQVVIAEEDDQKCPAIDHEGHNGSSASVDNTCEHNQKLGKVSNQPEGGEEPGPVPITNSYMHMLADMPLTEWLEYLPESPGC